MRRALSFSLLNLPARRHANVVVLAIVSVFISAHVSARDQGYLESINEEAESLEEVGNTDISAKATAPPSNDSLPEQSTDDQSTFIQQIHSQLYSNGNNESAYLKQLEKEVQNLPDSTTQSINGTQNNKSQQNQDDDLIAERNKVIEITEAQRKEMEIALESKIPGIYRLYKKLGLSQKQLVVKEYLTNERISTASKTILKLYGGH